ncbi:hypothetical protein [Echinicola shivajiensis]|uniref:hypothetical protein n=1 Tax=Echinicola shivajiensis TaxID=1035916 RepID=UPI001BFC8EB7|nr:hypothetical protein [Echinicola shivajiensis]
MDNINEFLKSEDESKRKGALLLQILGFENIAKTIGKFDDFDLWATYNHTPYLIEVKARTTYNLNSFNTHFLEESKLNRLQKYKGIKKIYLMIYNDGIILFNINKLSNYKIENKSLPATTAIKSNNIDKKVINLTPTSNDKIITLSQLRKMINK